MTTFPRRVSPRLGIMLALIENERAQGRPGGRCTRGLAQKIAARNDAGQWRSRSMLQSTQGAPGRGLQDVLISRRRLLWYLWATADRR